MSMSSSKPTVGAQPSFFLAFVVGLLDVAQVLFLDHALAERVRARYAVWLAAQQAAGREIEGPMAVVILGGLVTSTVLNLLVLPTLALRYGRFAPRDIDELAQFHSHLKLATETQRETTKRFHRGIERLDTP